MATADTRPTPAGPDTTHPFAVVTGASSGIGYELAMQLAEKGHDLLVVAEDSGIEQAAAAISAHGTKAESLRADLATPTGIHALVDRVQISNRPIDVLCLNAGVGVGGAFLDTKLEDEMNLIRLNIISPVHTAKHLLPRMVEQGHGRVLFTASVVSEMPAPFQAVYGASKAFVLMFAEAIRNELKDTGVTVTALQPGATDTNFFARAGMLDTKVGQAKKDDPADVARDGLKALFDNDDSVVAGSILNALQSLLGHITPETMKAEAARKLAEPEKTA